MTAAGIPVQNRLEIIEYLEALLLSQHIAIVKTEGHSIKKKISNTAQQDKLTDKYANLAAFPYRLRYSSGFQALGR